MSLTHWLTEEMVTETNWSLVTVCLFHFLGLYSTLVEVRGDFCGQIMSHVYNAKGKKKHQVDIIFFSFF